MSRAAVFIASSSAEVCAAVERAAGQVGLEFCNVGMDASASQVLGQARLCILDLAHPVAQQLAPMLRRRPEDADGDMLVVSHGWEGDQVRLHVLRYTPQQLVTTASNLIAWAGVDARRDPTGRLLGQSPAIELIREQVRSVARFHDVSVLILGASGTGKELVARAIHDLSVGPAMPFVAINCSAVSASLFESELFGHEAGSFTGASRMKRGLFEMAAEGTLFLDEIGDMPGDLQAKLLRTLETREFTRVGGTKPQTLSARVVSATHRGAYGDGATLRMDLHFRLAGFTMTLPRLAERREDIVPLARHFMLQFCKRHALPPLDIDLDAQQLLCEHDWPGNVRELRALIENVVITSQGSSLTSENVDAALSRPVPFRRSVPPSLGPPATETVPPTSAAPPGQSGTYRAVDGGSGTLREIERELIACAFQDASGNLSRAARTLGIPRSTLRDKLKRYGLL
ncbi:MAG: sigma-54 dependent transcriptional regulator [Polyangiaceae bacterium]